MEKSVVLPTIKQSKLVKWKVKPGTSFSNGSVLCLYLPDGEVSHQKLKATEVGTVHEMTVKEGENILPGSVVMKIKGCCHPVVMKDMCAECGADLREDFGQAGDLKNSTSASVAMVHSVPELIVSEECAVELGKADEERLLKNRKLVLLVDLDETVLHTTNDTIPNNLKDVYHFQLWHGPTLLWYHTKFRPNTQKFLQNISKLFELHIVTFGTRMYAHTMARYLDPEGKYFSHRILSRDECFDARSKTANLKALFPCGDTMVCIIDDREEVWNMAPNMIRVKPYIFFDGTADINAPPGMDKPGKVDLLENGNVKPKRNVKILKIPKETPQNNVSEMSQEQIDNKTDQVSDSESMEVDSECIMDVVNTKTKEEHDNGINTKTKDDGDNLKVESNNKMSVDPDEKDSKGNPVVADEKDDKSDKDGNQCGNEVQDDSLKCSDSSSGVTEESEMTGSEKDKKSPEVEGSVMEVEASALDDNEKKLSTKTSSGECDIDQGKEKSIEKDSNTKENTAENSATSNEETKRQTSVNIEYEEVIEWEDTDDYLMYLEDILTRIHGVYFDMYDKVANKSSTLKEDAPNLKKIIPYVKKKVLQGVNIVFSSVVPTNQVLETSRAFVVAKSLGANVHTELLSGLPDGECTTHLVAAKLGTQKVRTAMKQKGLHIVRPEWLWTCNDRWEHVEESLFLLDEKHQYKDARDSPDPAVVKEKLKRKAEEEIEQENEIISGKKLFKKAKINESNQNNTSSTLHTDKKESKDDGFTDDNQQPSTSRTRRFSETVNPLYSFSSQDFEDMGKEVDEVLSGESDSDDEKNKQDKNINKVEADESDDSVEAEKELRRKVLSGVKDSSSEDSMSGDFPRGWKRKTSPKPRDYDDNSHLLEIDDPGEANLALLKAAQSSPHWLFEESSNSEDESGESIGSVDEEMAAAVEKELFR